MTAAAGGAATGSSSEAALAQGAAQLGLALDSRQVQSLIAYGALLQRWNKIYNLTAVREPAQILSHHLLDCMSVITPLRRGFGSLQGTRVLDVGSGGGLPGVVLAILEPEMQVTCVDAVGKKAAFVQQARAELNLGNLVSKHARVEELSPEAGFDVIVSRAFASLADFVGLTRSLLSEGGVWVAMKAREPTDELSKLPADVEVFHVEQLQVPSLPAERRLIWMRPLS